MWRLQTDDLRTLITMTLIALTADRIARILFPAEREREKEEKSSPIVCFGTA